MVWFPRLWPPGVHFKCIISFVTCTKRASLSWLRVLFPYTYVGPRRVWFSDSPPTSLVPSGMSSVGITLTHLCIRIQPQVLVVWCLCCQDSQNVVPLVVWATAWWYTADDLILHSPILSSPALCGVVIHPPHLPLPSCLYLGLLSSSPPGSRKGRCLWFLMG